MGRINYVTIRGSKLSFGYPQNELCENLNADMVDNYHASQTAKPYTIPVAGADGKIDPEYLPAGIGGGDIKVVIDYVDYHKYVKQNEFIYITPQAHTDQEGASIDYYKWILPNGDVTTTPNSNPTLVYEDTSELGTLTFRVTAVDTYGNQSASKTINIEIVEELPPVINSISWNMTDFYENKSYIMTVNAESYENKPLSYQVTCDDPSVTIENYQDQQNKFLVTFPELTEEKLYNLNVVVSDGDLQNEKEEQCVAKPMLDFVYRFENVYACSNIVADNQGYLYIAVAISNNQIIFEKMDKALLTVERKAYNISAVLADSSTHKGRIALFIADDKLYALVDTYDEVTSQWLYYLIEIDKSNLQILRTSKGNDVYASMDVIATSICVIDNKAYIGGASYGKTAVAPIAIFDLNEMKEIKQVRGISSSVVKLENSYSYLLYDPTQDRIIGGHRLTKYGTSNYTSTTRLHDIRPISLDMTLQGGRMLRMKNDNMTHTYRNNDLTAVIINDKLYQIDFSILSVSHTFATAIVCDLATLPDVSSIMQKYNIKCTSKSLSYYTSNLIHTKLMQINSSELIYMFHTTAGTRGSWGCHLIKFNTDFEILGTARLDSINEDRATGILKESIVLDGYIYIPIITKINSDTTLCIAKINTDIITNDNNVFSLQSYPFYFDIGIYRVTTEEGAFSWSNVSGDLGDIVDQGLEKTDETLTYQEISYTPETYRDPFI